MSNLKQYNVDLLKLMQRYTTEQELLNLSKHLESRANNLAVDNLSFREAKSCLIIRSVKGGN